MSLKRIILIKNLGIDLMGAGQGWEGPGWARPSSYLVTGPAPIRSIPEIFIKNILRSDIFPGHSSSADLTFQEFFLFFKKDY